MLVEEAPHPGPGVAEHVLPVEVVELPGIGDEVEDPCRPAAAGRPG